MTGFGRGSAEKNGQKINAEIRAVNSRFLELKIRGISLNPQLEAMVREKVTESLQRGTIHIKLDYSSTQDLGAMKFNRQKYEKLQSIIQEIHMDYGQRLDIGDIITASDLISAPEPSELNAKILLDAVNFALNQVNEMREKEGEKIEKDLTARLKDIRDKISMIEEESKKYQNQKMTALREKISDLLSNTELDENRLIQEVAYFVEKADVTEELVRSRSHFDHLDSFFELEDPVGKRLNFLLQEIGREVNTIGAKSPMPNVTKLVVDIKAELEKIREQVQNIL